MEDKNIILNKSTFEFPNEKIKLTLIHRKLQLHLRTSFNTSHSNSTIRNMVYAIRYYEKMQQ